MYNYSSLNGEYFICTFNMILQHKILIMTMLIVTNDMYIYTVHTPIYVIWKTGKFQYEKKSSLPFTIMWNSYSAPDPTNINNIGAWFCDGILMITAIRLKDRRSNRGRIDKKESFSPRECTSNNITVATVFVWFHIIHTE